MKFTWTTHLLCLIRLLIIRLIKMHSSYFVAQTSAHRFYHAVMDDDEKTANRRNNDRRLVMYSRLTCEYFAAEATAVRQTIRRLIELQTGRATVAPTLSLIHEARYKSTVLLYSILIASTSCTYLWSPYGIGQTIIFLPCGFFFLSFYPTR